MAGRESIGSSKSRPLAPMMMSSQCTWPLAGLPSSTTALAGVDLAVDAGECVAVIGPTGSGKTTLLEVMAGLTRPTEGSAGLEPEGADPGLRGAVGLAYQFPESQFFEETVFADVAFGPVLQGLAEQDVRRRVQEALSRIAVPENVKVASQLDEALPIILADPDQLVQVFGHIALNAIQAMPEGGRLVVRSEVPTPGWMAVSFADTGVGISEENMDKLFEPLFTTKAKGIGLGMAVSKTLMEGHGGTIEVESQVGEGTTFSVRLPISVD